MAFKLYVGGLSYDTTEDELKNLFSTHGTVESAVIIKDKFSGRSKGFGFVEMSTDDEGQAAIKALNSSEFGGRNITVNQARPQEDRPRSGGFGGGGPRSNRQRY